MRKSMSDGSGQHNITIYIFQIFHVNETREEKKLNGEHKSIMFNSLNNKMGELPFTQFTMSSEWISNNDTQKKIYYNTNTIMCL